MSKSINNPKLSDVKSNGKNSAIFTIEPLYTGYGNTLGNSLRRVLLSSIEGAAIVAFKVAGATHEFTTLKGVKEDVVEIMINLKNVAVKSHSERPVELTLSKKGAGEVTAADISANADIEIVDKDALICTIDDPKAKIDMNLVVDNGRGYLTIEDSSVSRRHSDMIALDAMFSPIVRVRYNVEKTRVGQNADYDKLIITIDTDGSITPKQAFEEAAAILVNQYTALAGSTTVEAATMVEAEIPQDDTSVLDLPIEELDFTARTLNALTNGDVKSVGDLVTLYNSGEMENLKGFGKTAFEEVSKRIAELEF
ncbi:MAG: DNA-directed RNA polymerase subunit alpha [Candidatus Nomurabacteria bacterium]|jgi:DNA-directed RNA polymerase subunit alpha|nr:DNA-directed RNA polymerase subunit alpha [Candidatus Nomurabacteria bacterium]